MKFDFVDVLANIFEPQSYTMFASSSELAYTFDPWTGKLLVISARLDCFIIKGSEQLHWGVYNMSGLSRDYVDCLQWYGNMQGRTSRCKSKRDVIKWREKLIQYVRLVNVRNSQNLKYLTLVRVITHSS